MDTQYTFNTFKVPLCTWYLEPLNEVYCNKQEQENTMNTDLANTRRYLDARLNEVYFEKLHDAQKLFGIIAEYPKTNKEAVEWLKSGNFIWTNGEGDTGTAADEVFDSHEFSHTIKWGTKIYDAVGYSKVEKAIENACQEARDVVNTSDEAAGYKALKEFQAATFH